MKSFFAASVLFLVAGLPTVGFATGDDLLPKAMPANRYDKLANQSPFTPPTAPAPVDKPVQAPPWTSKYTVVGVMQDATTSSVTVVDHDTNERFRVSTDPEIKNTRDLSLASIKWSDRVNDMKVTLRRGTSDFGDVPFDAGNAASVVSAPGGGMPGAFGRPNVPTLNRLVNPSANNSAPQPLNGGIRRPAPIHAAPGIPGDGSQRPAITNTQPPQQFTTRPAVSNNDDDDE